VRVELAAAYRLADYYSMTELMSNHISSSVPGEEGHFLMNLYGMLYDEITAFSLVKVKMDGDTVLSRGDYGSTGRVSSSMGRLVRSASAQSDRDGIPSHRLSRL